MTTLSTRQTIALVVLFVVTSLTFIQLDNRRALEPIKAALEMLGLASERMRLPLVPADAEQRAAVRAALEGLGLPLADN